VRQNRIKRPEIGLVAPSKTPVAVPKAPTGLLASSRRRWRDYWESQVAQAADRVADLHRVERWIHAVDEYERVRPIFRRTRLVKGSTGQIVLNPLASYLAQIEATIQRAETDLGLTPVARLRLGIAYGQAALTADELNRRLDDPPSEQAPEATETWEAEWQAV
jgi:P27 family predicted phage terminase small subunit